MLGCTLALASDVDAMVFIVDGRFHLESAMIQNPHVTAYQYNPYSKVMSVENYQTQEMHTLRYEQIKRQKKGSTKGGTYTWNFGSSRYQKYLTRWSIC